MKTSASLIALLLAAAGFAGCANPGQTAGEHAETRTDRAAQTANSRLDVEQDKVINRGLDALLNKVND